MSVSTTEKEQQGGGIGETLKVVVHALILAMLVRTFLFQPFNIPSGSMKDTLLIGDYLFVSKFSYGYSRYSLPYGGSINWNGRVWAAEPKRGDVVVFKLPTDGTTDYIKRVIGLPGDRIQMKRGILHINGEAVPRKPDGEFVEQGPFGGPVRAKRYIETLPNGVSYHVLKQSDEGAANDTQEYVVPAGHFFMMGDNRDNSQDSRFLSAVGYVPFDNLIGRAQIIFFSIEEGQSAWQIWTWPWSLRWNRLLGWI
jgi:signal peptidase I